MDDSNPACQQAPHLVGDPVDTLTGAVTDQKLEFRLVGPLELAWMRHYDSAQHQRSFALGWGHTHGYDRRLRFEGGLETGQLVYEGILGERLEFPLLRSDGEQLALHGHRLVRASAQRYVLHRHAEPSMAFEFSHPERPARLALLFKGRHQIRFFHGRDDGLLEGIVDSLGRRISVLESADGRLHSLTLLGRDGQPDELLVAYRYDAEGNLQSTRNQAGHGYSFSFDEQHRLTSSTGRKGFRFQYSYDAQGRCVLAMGEDRLYGVALNYAVPGRQTLVTRPDHGVWRYAFDAAGRLTQIQDALGGVQTFVRDPSGRVVFELDQNKALTQVRYDEAGAPVARITPHGHRIDLPQNPNAGDPRDRRVAGTAAEFEYGALFDHAPPALPPGPLVTAAGLPPMVAGMVVLAAAGPAPAPTSFKVEPLGALWWPQPVQGRVFSHLGKLVSQLDDAGRERRWQYDASGNMVEYIDFDGSRWTYDTGKWHLPLMRSNPLQAIQRWTHNPAGKVASFVDAGGTTTEFGYDLNDHLVEVRRHGVLRDSYKLDAAGNLLAKYAAGGRELLRLEIGPVNLPVKRTLASGDEHTLRYDGSGRCVAANTLKDSLRFAYDENGHCILDLRNDQGVEHDYRGGNWPVQSVFFGRFTVRCELSLDRVLITDPTGKQQLLRFLGHRLVQRCFSNGTQETSQHDVLGRCLFKAAQHPSGRVWSRRYHWSGEGELRRIEDSACGAVEHAYDAAHRLLHRHDERGTEAFEFDLADNLLRQPGLAGVRLDGNRLVEANGRRYVHDDRQHIALSQGPDGEVRYAYDSHDLLVRIESPQGLWEAEYDACQRRSRKTWRGATTNYFWHGDQLIAEVAPEGRLRIYLYADPLALTPLMFIDYESVDADPASGLRRFVFTDQIGAPCLVEDDNGDVLWKASMQPFGSAHVTSPAGLQFNFRFPGHYLDAETGLHYNRFRYYDPLLGRYLQSDPWGIAGGPNVYAYRSNPLLKADVRGLGEDGGEPCSKPDPNKEGNGEPTPPDRRRMTDAELQSAADHIRMGNGDYKPGGGGRGETGDYHTITITEGMVNGQPVYTVTSSKAGGLTDRQANRVAEVFGPNGANVPPQDRSVTGTPAGHSEQRGAAATADQQDRRQATSNITPSTRSDPDTPHMGAACSPCAACQRNATNSQGEPNPVTNVTGTVEDGGRTNNPSTSDWKGWSNENKT